MEELTDRADESTQSSLMAWRRAPGSMTIASLGGAGHLPLAPGTIGAAVAVPPAIACADFSWLVRFGLLTIVTAVAIPASTRAGLVLDDHDSSIIIVDEFVGMWATLVWFSDLSWLVLGLGFVAFRTFDIKKPPSARWFHHAHPNGVGVIGDDLAAAIWAAATVALVVWGFG